MRASVSVLFGAALLWAGAAAADEPGWSGEGALSAAATTGNTETTQVGVSLALAHESQLWRHAGEFKFDYAEQEGETSKDRVFGAYQADRTINDRLFGFVRVSYEQDQFSGFDSRASLGVGVGYDVIENPATKWSVRAAPGVRIDDVEAVPADGETPAVEGGVEQSFAAILGSAFEHHFNDAVTLKNDTRVVYASSSAQTNNEISLTAQMTKAWSARASYEVRYVDDPPDDREPTDTATKFGLVYSF